VHRLLLLMFAMSLPSFAMAQALFEDFDGGVFPPSGWTVVDNTGNGPWLLNTDYGRTNFTGGTGVCAAIDGDAIGWGALDTELITPSFSVPWDATLEFDHSFRWYSGGTNEQGDVEISVNGGAWVLLQSFVGGDDGYPAGVRKILSLSPYAGENVQIRFRYYNTNWDWWWQIDNVVVASSPSTGTGYCFGDPGSGTPCPCNNDNDGSVPGSGCDNGVFASGAQLTGSGVADVTADTLVLATTGLEPSNSGLYFQANNNLSPGNIWGDGLQCAGGQLKRLGVRFSDASGYSDTSGYPQPISVKAGNVMAGDTKYYQCWYRNPLNSPCGSDFNASNGYSITWMP
jgi:hypothetical protein